MTSDRVRSSCATAVVISSVWFSHSRARDVSYQHCDVPVGGNSLTPRVAPTEQRRGPPRLNPANAKPETATHTLISKIGATVVMTVATPGPGAAHTVRSMIGVRTRAAATSPGMSM